MKASKRLILALTALAPLATASPAAAQTGDRFETSNGRVVRLQAVEQMSCRDLLRKIDEIDATNYRGLNSAPRDLRDLKLFDYENRVSTRYYTTCGSVGDNRATAGEVLRGGFRPRAASN